MATGSSVGFAASVGGLAGASLAAHRGVRSAAGAAFLGAVGLGTSEAVARARQKEGEIPALWQRIAVSAALAAPLGWVAGKRPTPGHARSARRRAPWSARWGCGRRRWRWVRSWAPPSGRRSPGARRRRRRGQQHGPGLPQHVCAGLPRRTGQPAGRAGQRRRPAVRRTPSGAFEVRRHRVRPGAGGGARSPVHRRRPGHRDRGLDRRAGGTGVRPRAGRSVGPGVLRAHHAVRAGHRPAVAAVGTPRLSAVPHRGRAAPWSGQHPDEPARGPARDPQPDRHDRRNAEGRRHGVGARLDPVVRRRRRADHARHLHHLHPRTAVTSASGSRCQRAASPPPSSRGHGPTAA